MAVADVMTRDVVTCSNSDNLNRAAQLMWERRCGCLPVVDNDNRVVGLLTDRDVCMDGKGDVNLEPVALTLGEVARRNLGPGQEEPPTEVPETDLVDFVQNSLAALKTLRDEIRVDLNLAGKEVRDRWRRLEARLQAAETQARDARQDAARNLAEVVDSAKQFRSRLRGSSRRPAEGKGSNP